MSLMNEYVTKSASQPSPDRPGAQASDGNDVRTLLPAKLPRYGFIDLLRGFAILVMIETHVINAYLPVSFRKGSEFFFWLAFVNGLVAPTFLFATGFSLMLQTKSQWESWIRLRLPFWKQIRRLGFITLVAYYMHLQEFSLSRYLQNWGNANLWTKSLQVDVLQCIVVSLLAVYALILVVRSKRWFPWGIGLLLIFIALATPRMWAQDFRGELPLSVALFMNPHGISLFPIFPWMSFVLAGSLASYFFLRAADGHSIPKYMRITSWLGILLIIGGLLLRNVPYTLPGYVNFYTTSPLYVAIRLGCVLIICAILYVLETKAKWVPKPIQLAGQESLLVYGAHLLLIFGILRGKYLSPILGRQSGYLGCFLMSAAIILAMLFLAQQWHSLKRHYPGRTKLSQAIVVICMIIVFALG